MGWGAAEFLGDALHNLEEAEEEVAFWKLY